MKQNMEYKRSLKTVELTFSINYLKIIKTQGEIIRIKLYLIFFY